VVAVEGLIASGKSTLAAELGKLLPGAMTLIEPDEESGNPYLDDYYADPTRWGLTMQVHLLAIRFRMQQVAQWHALSGQGPVILDRSYYGDTCFARMLVGSGKMTLREFETYRGLYQDMTASVLFPSICLRLLVDPEVANRRIESRAKARPGRCCEKAIDLNYLLSLDREIERMVGVLSEMGTQVLDIPWDADLPPDSPVRADIIRGLVSRIARWEPQDTFLDAHRRLLM
jgi:deoxyadenosine/deoxycytidine kinase